MTSERARDVILSSIDKALTRFGESVRAVVYYELENSSGVLRQEIPIRPEQFASTIDRIFSRGAAVIRRAIVEELEKSSGIKDLSKTEFVYAIRNAYHSQLEKMS